MARARVIERSVLSSWDALIGYCRTVMAYRDTEQFRILFLDRKNVLIADEPQAKGTVDHVPVYPREVAKRALELNASAVILVHNHPSGDPTPSQSDIDMTGRVEDACRAIGVALHDHVVIGKGAHTPFCDPESISRQLFESLDRLGTDHLDLYLMHRDNVEVPVGEFVDVLNEHAEAGRIRAFGGSNWSIERFEEANAYAAAHGKRGFAALSNHFGLARALDVPWAGCVEVTDPTSRACCAAGRSAGASARSVRIA